MLSPTTRSMLITYFDILCVNTEDKSIITIPAYLIGEYNTHKEILKAVKKQSIVSTSLLVRRITNIRRVIEQRSMSANKFYKNSVLKRSYEYVEGIENQSGGSKTRRIARR